MTGELASLALITITVLFEESYCKWIHRVRDIRTVHKNAYLKDDTKAINLPQGSHVFNLQSEYSTKIQAFGSINDNCTAEISCDEINFPLKPANQDGDECSSGFITIEDSFGSQQMGCGQMEFGLPIRPSRGGTDIYVEFKGTSKGTTCTIKCGRNEDFVELPKTRHSGVFQTKQCVCGKKKENEDGVTNDRIIGGRTTGEFEFPWMVSIVRAHTGKNYCGGSLINDLYVLTAAHCFEQSLTHPEKYQVLLHAHLLDFAPNKLFTGFHVTAGEQGSVKALPGLHLANKTDEDENRIRINVESIMIHPLFTYQPAQQYDAAILRLERRVNLVNNEGGRVGTVCLPKLGTNEDHAGKTLSVTGWGRPAEFAGAGTRLLQEVEVTIWDKMRCKNKLRSDWVPAVFCASFEGGKKDACQGDSGSPAVVKLDNYYEETGIVSWGFGCALPGKPGVYASTSELNEWIHHSTQNGIWCSYP